MKRFLIPLFAVAVCIFHAGAAVAQSDRDVRIESGQAKKLAVPAGKLMRVDEGVFTIKFGQTIDLTNRRILLTIKYGRPSWDRESLVCCQLALNGQILPEQEPADSTRLIGERIDLKRLESTSSYVEDKERCFVDVVDVVDRKGAPGTATFRLFCE
jgi:hypothetical protein